MHIRAHLRAAGSRAIWGLRSSLAISTIKSTVALTLLYVLVFIRPFARLSPHPKAWNASVLVIIAASPGKTTGGFVDAALLGGLGIALGCLLFYILALLHTSPVAQALIFALHCYGCALVRFYGQRFISFYLFAILFAFQGIHTSIVESTGFDRTWFVAYLEAYAFGLAISVFVNLLFPQTSEAALLSLVVDSLENIATLAHLACKTYAREITPEEKEVWQLLSSTIRHDYSLLDTLLSETSWEVTYSRYGIRDYRQITKRIQALQQALISSSSALVLIEKLDPVGQHTAVPGDKSSAAVFSEFRYSVDLVIRDVVDNLQRSRRRKIAPDTETTEQKGTSLLHKMSTAQADVRVLNVQARLQQEVRQTVVRQKKLRQALRAQGRTESYFSSTSFSIGGMATPGLPGTDVHYLERAWTRVKTAYTSEIVDAIRNGSSPYDDELEIKHGLPSLEALYRDHLPKSWQSTLVHSSDIELTTQMRSKGSSRESSATERLPLFGALTKSFSLLESLSFFTEELTALNHLVSRAHQRRIQFNFLHKDPRVFLKPLRRIREERRVRAALAAVQGKIWEPRRRTYFTYVLQLEHWFRSDHSFFGVRVALGATCYLVLLLAATTRSFFVRYDVQTSLITIISAMVSSAGQSLFVWTLQISGTGFGAIFALVTLEIFAGRGGWPYNPYGVVSFLAIWAAIASFLMFRKSQLFTVALLATNGAGVACILEWLYSEVIPGTGQPTPPLRAAHALAALCISVAISAILQIVVFRIPARRQLRLALASVMFRESQYNVMLQTLINTVAPIDAPECEPDHEAVRTIEAALIKREKAIQEDILALRPLLDYARLEPKYSMPLQVDTLERVINSQQVILDRLRDSRSAVGTEGFSERVHRDFVSALSPYRLHSQKLSRTLFYLAATSLLSKSSLSRDMPKSTETWAAFEHDALVLSKRLSMLPGGPEELEHGRVLRYFYYLVSLSSVASELESLEETLGVLYADANWSQPL